MPWQSESAEIEIVKKETWEYTINQDRTLEKLNAYTNADAVAPLFQGLTAAACQTFMAIRCTKIATKKHFVWPVLAAGVCLSLGGAAWLTVENCEWFKGKLQAGTETWPML